MATVFPHVDAEFIGRVGLSLRRFKLRKSLANFRCPFCGDSHHSKQKARGYFLVNKDGTGTRFYCHNCNVSLSLQLFLDSYDVSLSDEYRMRRFSEKRALESWDSSKPTTTTPAFDPFETPADVEVVHDGRLVFLQHATAIVNMKKDTKGFVDVMKCLSSRRIPINEAKKLWYASTAGFYKIAMSGDNPPEWEPRPTDKHSFLVIPMRDFEGKIFACQGRAIGPSTEKGFKGLKYNGPKYMTVYFNKKIPKAWGYDRIKDSDVNEYVIVVEGPIDAMFLPNAIAMAGASPSEMVAYVKNRKFIFVYDNEPRNHDILVQMQKRLDEGHKILIWDSPEFDGLKDINDMVKSGLTTEFITQYIKENAIDGLMGTLKLKKWSKC